MSILLIVLLSLLVLGVIAVAIMIAMGVPLSMVIIFGFIVLKLTGNI